MSEAPKAATFNSNITDIARLLMAHGDINQTELADRMGVSRSSISKKLEGTRQWGFKDIDRLSQAFDEPPANRSAKRAGSSATGWPASTTANAADPPVADHPPSFVMTLCLTTEREKTLRDVRRGDRSAEGRSCALGEQRPGLQPGASFPAIV